MKQNALFLLFFFISKLLFSEIQEATEDFFSVSPSQAATLSLSQEELIGGLISPLSGNLSMQQTDLIVKGAQEIRLSRTYLAPPMPCLFPQEGKNQKEWDQYFLYHHLARNYKGWQFYPHLKLIFYPQQKEILVTDPSGMALSFYFTDPKCTKTELKDPPYGLSNLSGAGPSGKNDPRNTRIVHNREEESFTVYAPDGSIRYYRKERNFSYLATLYLLEKETLANGKILKYHYQNSQPSYVESLSSDERFVYASIRIQGSPWQGTCHFLSSSGQEVDYHYQRRTIEGHIRETQKDKYGKIKIERDFHLTCPPILTTVSSPFFRKESLGYCDRFILSEYNGKKRIFKTLNGAFGSFPHHYRIHTLYLPSGENNAFAEVYTFSYDPPIPGEKGGTTTALRCDGTKTIYHFSKALLITCIEFFDAKGTLRKSKRFTWDQRHFIKAIEICDDQNALLTKTTYTYDHFGNPIEETFIGNLTGSGQIEESQIKRTFSEDGRHLLLTETDENGKTIHFSYLPKTSLLLSKLTKDKEEILLREFYLYDDCHNLIKEIVDDGSSKIQEDLSDVTYRRITRYLLRQKPPFLHMKEWVIETYLDEGEEKLLEKRHLLYDTYGNIAEEEVYDKDEHLAYILYKTYNERGDLLTETNRLGDQASYTYDAKGRLLTKTNFSNRLKTTNSYDLKGRLKKSTQRGDDGTIHTTLFAHDRLDRITEKKDPFGNPFSYRYDPSSGKIAETTFPSLLSLEKAPLSVKTFATYDAFGRKTTTTDANGNITSYRYNAYGSIAEKTYPNRAKETFTYAKNGDLLRYKDLNGLTIFYTRDCLSRPLSKTYHSKEGEFLARETLTYKGAYLISKTDKQSQETQVFHDGAGRKIGEKFCGRITEFDYDSLNRLSCVRRQNGESTLLIHRKKDLEGRTTEETKTDSFGNLLSKIAMTYDGDNNKTSITKEIHGKKATTIFAFDPFQRQILKEDPLGLQTTTHYNENEKNSLGQNALEVTTIDPTGKRTIKTHNALGDEVSLTHISSEGTLLSSQTKSYDAAGNLLLQEDHIYLQGDYQTTQQTHFSYTCMHNLKRLTRGKATKNERTTSYTYTNAGKKKTKTLPDQTVLNYTYHPLGFLEEMTSSDDVIHHTFAYNRLGHLLRATDENHNSSLYREVDPFGNVIKETFPTGLKITKTYDLFDRVTSLSIPHLGTINYTYDPLSLRKIERTSKTFHYVHTFDTYDLDGNLIQETLLGDLGTTTYEKDLRGQTVKIQSPYFDQICSYDRQGNLIFTQIDGRKTDYTYDETSQLMSEKTEPQEITYTHDSLYNRTQKNEEDYQINVLNELLETEKTSYAYDQNGNQVRKETAEGTQHRTYDPLGRLTEIITNNAEITFTYDPLGRRLSKTIKTGTEEGKEEESCELYLYDKRSEIGAFVSPNQPKNFRLLTPNKILKTIAVEIEGHLFAAITDVQGNICHLIDPNLKKIAASASYCAFGESLFQAEKPFLSPWQFAGKRLDPDSNLIYFGNRNYDPFVGRWIEPDPLGFIDSVNLYQYNFNNPYIYFDPEGLAAALAFAPVLLQGGAGVSVSWGATACALSGPMGWAIGIGALAYTGYKVYEAYKEKHLPVPVKMPEKSEGPHLPQQGGPNLPPALGPVIAGAGIAGSATNSGTNSLRKTPGNLQKQIQRGNSPKSVARADKGRGSYEKDHLHFKDGSALHSDGTWKHGKRELTTKEIDWLKKNGWDSPK